MKLERSAGFILFRSSPDHGREYLLLDYGSHWDFPKGHVESGEDDLAAARRELQEETGITSSEVLSGFAQEISYVFRGRKGGMIKKSVIFFLAVTDSHSVILSHEHVGYSWLPADEAMQIVTYPNARAVLSAAIGFMQKLTDAS